MMAPAADAALVDRLRRGDRLAFRELYARFAQPSFGFLLRLCGRRDQAEDLHQETWLAVARHAGRTPAAHVEPPVVEAHDDPGAHDLGRALRSLPDTLREILLLVGVEGL